MKFSKLLPNLYKGLLSIALAILSTVAFAQGGAIDRVTVSGTIVDVNGVPVIGAAVIDPTDTSNGCISDAGGNFSMKAAPGVELVVSCIGYADYKFTVSADKQNYDIVLQEDALMLEETVVVGYGVQKKVTMTGSVSAVKNSEIITTKNENVQNMLTGKVAGLRVVQNSSEPGSFNTSMDIRGFGSPLVVIDGVPRDNMARVDPEDIESISVLKDASAAVYGVRAANGVVLITTKKGKEGRATISYSGNMTWQIPSNFPELTDAVDWMTLYNEMSMHNVDNQTITYPQSQIDEYRNGTKKSIDWRREVIRNSAPQTQHNINVSGGNDKISYFASVGYQYQESFFKSNPITYDKYNVRSNISAKIARNLTFDLNLSGMMDEKQQTPYGAGDIVRAMWLMQPMDQVWYDEEAGQYWQPSNTGLQNPVVMMSREMTGTNTYKSKWFQSSATLTYDLPWVKGLSVKGMYSYDFIMNENKEYRTAYSLYNSAGQEYTWLAETDAPNRIGRYYYGKNHSLWQVSVNYNRAFGKHNVGGLLLFENQHKVGDNFYGTRQVKLDMDEVFAGISDKQQFMQSTSSGSLYDYANQALVGRVNYDYANKYIAEFAFRYEGSSRFPEDSRWGFFPSVSAGYRVSEEKFWKESPLKFINDFKVRASWGIMGDDSALSYQFLTGYNYPASGTNATKLPPGSVFDGSFVNSSNTKGLANKGITWYTSETLNIGVDAEAWNGLLGVTAEYFRRHRDGLLATRVNSLPGVVGATLPQENLNSDLTQGFEIELSHENRAGDFYYQIKANISYTRTKTLHYEQAKQGNSYLDWRNNNNDRYNNIWWGYEGNGRIENWNEIYYNPVYVGRGTILGDYEYLDWNGDGWINDLDVHPIATNGQVPLIYFGLTFSAQWRGLDFSMLLQGAGQKYVAPREFLYQPLWANTNAITDFLDRWHPADPQANPYDPATEWVKGEHAYTGSLPNANSDFNVQNAAYLRVKNIEIGYTLPQKWLRAINIQGLRIYVSAYNLLTITGLKYMDPEFYTSPSGGGIGDLGYNYPINKSVSLGLNIKF